MVKSIKLKIQLPDGSAEQLEISAADAKALATQKAIDNGITEEKADEKYNTVILLGVYIDHEFVFDVQHMTTIFRDIEDVRKFRH